MNTIIIDCSEINDWESFHLFFKKTFGFPDFYGNNMNAWIDCMSYLDEDDGMSAIKIEKGTVLTLRLENISAFSTQCKEIYDALIECTASVNYRRTSIGEPSIIALSFYN